jgi:hypothetical protein
MINIMLAAQRAYARCKSREYVLQIEQVTCLAWLSPTVSPSKSQPAVGDASLIDHQLSGYISGIAKRFQGFHPVCPRVCSIG